MKLLYLTHQYFPRHVGGTEVYLRGIVRRAVAANHECQIISCHESSSGNPADFHIERTEFEDVPLLEIHFNLSVTKFPARYEYSNPFVEKIVARELASFNPNLVHVMHNMKLSGSALHACHVAGVPVIVTLCDFWFICPRHTLLKWDESLCNGPTKPLKCVRCLKHQHRFATFPTNPRKLISYFRDLWAIKGRTNYLRNELLQARRIIALSEFQKRMFTQNDYPSDRIEVIPHGIEVCELGLQGENRTSIDKQKEVLRLGFIGNLVHFKGAHILIQAVTHDPLLQVECLIYGPLTESSYCRKLRALASGDSRIKFMGEFPTDDFGRVLRSMDILAIPALWYENNPLVVQAALHIGIPVMASRIGSLSDMIRPGQNGWLVEPGNIDMWTKTIREIIPNPLPLLTPAQRKTMDINAAEILEIYNNEVVQ